MRSAVGGLPAPGAYENTIITVSWRSRYGTTAATSSIVDVALDARRVAVRGV
jgi:hypothetical protein